MKRTLLLDGDVFCYEASASSETEIHWDEQVSTREGNLSKAKADFTNRINTITEKLKGDSVVIAFSDPTKGYWRRQVLPTYKANRTGHKPVVYWPLREWVVDNYDCKTKPALEGDDVLGILSTHPTLIKGEKVIVSIDKDMKTIPGLLCRNIGEPEDNLIQEITEFDANYWHMYQTLIGDTTDGYKGCPGMGPKGAEKLLDGWETKPQPSAFMWDAIVTAYEKKGLSEEAALVQARVARILRCTDYDFTTKTPILWNPPTNGKAE